METLSAIREENIVHLSGSVTCETDVAFLDIQRLDNKNSIFIIENHDPNIVQHMLSTIDDDSSGYIFFKSELKLDPINNCMVPKHREATDEEINCLLSRRILLDKLPILRMKDPIRRWHNFKKGSVVAIERPNEQQPYFRRVI